MFRGKRVIRQNLAIEESAKVIVAGLIYGQVPSEDMLAETYSANLKKNGISPTRNFDLIELLNGTILHIQTSHFLTTEQKAKFRAQLGEVINELRNPFGKADYQLEEVLGTTRKIQERVSDEQIDRNNVLSLAVKIEEDLKKIKLSQARPEKDRFILKAMINFLGFSGKTLAYGLTFNSLVLLAFTVYQYFTDSDLFKTIMNG